MLLFYLCVVWVTFCCGGKNRNFQKHDDAAVARQQTHRSVRARRRVWEEESPQMAPLFWSGLSHKIPSGNLH